MCYAIGMVRFRKPKVLNDRSAKIAKIAEESANAVIGFARGLRSVQKNKGNAPIKSVAVPKDIEFISVIDDNGVLQRYNKETGELLCSESQVNSVGPKYEVYNKEKADIFFQCLSSGVPLKQSLLKARISYTTYLQWRKSITVFTGLVEAARSARSEHTHEEFYEKEIVPLNNEDISDINDDDRLNFVTRKHKAVMQKQNILSNFQKLDAPGRFGPTFVHHTGSVDTFVRLITDISKEVIDLSDKFRPKIDRDGGLFVEGSKERLQEIEVSAVEKKVSA